MQTFLPYFCFKESARVLDYRRLGKQRVEAKQIYDVLQRKRSGETNIPWGNHPAVLQWVGYSNLLALYHNCIIEEWIKRGYKNNMPFLSTKPEAFILGNHPWIGNKKYHSSHRAALLAKDYDYYSQFGWTEEPKIDYFWPSKEKQCI